MAQQVSYQHLLTTAWLHNYREHITERTLYGSAVSCPQRQDDLVAIQVPQQ